MNIIVCVKQILDPDIPMDKFRIRDNQVIPPEGIPPVMNPYDAQAVEVALRLKEKDGGQITAISMGTADARDVVRYALAMGADDGIILSDDAFTKSDSLTIAYILTQAIRKIGNFDLILCGREAVDWNMGIVGPFIAEGLKLPLITLAKNIELLNDGVLRVEQVMSDGYQVFEVSPPAVVTVSNEVGSARLPSGMGIIKAIRRDIPVWTSQDIEADSSLIGVEAERSKLLSLILPERERKCEFVNGESPAEIAANLAKKLKETRAI